MALDHDIKLARAATLRPIMDIAKDLGIPADCIEPYGHYKAKIRLDAIDKLGAPRAKLVVVTAMTPTPMGEGKTVNTIGLSLGLNRIGHKAIAALRQPSLGPFFGVKGGAAGGGRSQVLPMDDINLRLTGDIDAVASSHNLLAALVDNHLFHGNKLDLEPAAITFRRVVDMNDRALRSITVSAGGKTERASGYDIAVASEVMAILALAGSYKDLRERLGKIVVGRTRGGKPITATDLKAAGAMAVLLRDAFKPNLLQTMENTPAIIHAGPFANIAHGNSSVVADRIAVRCGDFVVTESGFGADLGFEKFADIKCRASGMAASAAMIVATIRACKLHGGDLEVKSGKPLPKGLTEPDPAAVQRGTANLAHMVGIVRKTGLPAVVAINAFPGDTAEEIDIVKRAALAAGAHGAVVIEAYGKGGEGAIEAANAIVAATSTPSTFRMIYESNRPIKEKIETIAREVYGADGVDYTPRATEEIERYTAWGLDKLAICMAKTQLSISHDPKLRGKPTGFRVQVQEVRASAGAGFLYPLLGDVMTMPGLPTIPASENMDIDEQGNLIDITG